MTVSFHPQPYPLYAVTIEKATEPSRFQLTDAYDPVRLVIGWRTDDQATWRHSLREAIRAEPPGRVPCSTRRPATAPNRWPSRS
jgi:hypothetical protein